MFAVNAIQPTRRVIVPAIKDYHLYFIAVLAALAWCNAMMFVIVRVNNLRDQAKGDVKVAPRTLAVDLQEPATGTTVGSTEPGSIH